MAKDFQWNGDKIEKKVRVESAKVLKLAALGLETEANKTVPMTSEGILQSSSATSVDPVKLEAVVSYDTPYAAYQHETPGLNYTRPQARWKWLELTLTEKSPAIMAFIAKGIGKALKG